MIYAWKDVSETPLECLERFRKGYPALHKKTLSYAGRLDPMASGVLPLLVNEENKKADAYQQATKKYQAVFLVGIATDSQDVLGLIKESEANIFLEEKDITQIINSFLKLKKQKYPWFSAKTVHGIKLFDHYKNGNNSIDRPEHKAKVLSVAELEKGTISTEVLFKDIERRILHTTGDFRQEQIISLWHDFCSKNKKQTWQTISCSIEVEAGTYIRTLTELFPVPTVLLKLKRTAVYL